MNTTKPNWIIFDSGGVLNDFDQSIHTTAKYLGVSENDLLHAYFKNFKEVEVSKVHYKEKLQSILDLLKSDKDIYDVIPLLFTPATYLPDSLKLVEQLHAAGYSLALLTNTWHGITEDVISKLDESKFFSHIFDSSALGMRKPEDDIFIHVQKTLHKKNAQLFLIDDRLENIEKAKEFGWQTYLYSLGEDKGRSSNDELRRVLLSNH